MAAYLGALQSAKFYSHPISDTMGTGAGAQRPPTGVADKRGLRGTADEVRHE
jgi:hypothetical protein